MKTTGADFITEKNKLVNRPTWLFTVYDFDGAGNDLHYASHDSDIVFDGITYTRFPIKLDFVSNNTTGAIDSIRVTVGNASRFIQQYLETYDFRGKKVSCSMVFLDKLSDTSNVLREYFYIDSYTAGASEVVFVLSSKFDILNLQIPSRIYMRSFCSWKFKGTECAYAGATTSCNKTATACKDMSGGSNFQRFGGFPSVPQEPIYVA